MLVFPLLLLLLLLAPTLVRLLLLQLVTLKQVHLLQHAVVAVLHHLVTVCVVWVALGCHSAPGQQVGMSRGSS
jgi:hypothetical protein